MARGDAEDVARQGAASALLPRVIPPKDRLIVALDFPSGADALAFADLLGDEVTFYKLGLELLMAGGYFDVARELVQRGKKVMLDLKFYDVPQTVHSAVRGLNGFGATFTTVHGNGDIVRAAVAAAEGVEVLAVTVLTSLDVADLREMGLPLTSVESLVLARTRMAMEAGCAGVVASGREAELLRMELGNGMVIVTPGIRPVGQDREGDQKRAVSPRRAFQSGADYIVVGRPIRAAPDPRRFVEIVQAEIAELFEQVNG
jgi:orotidine-5'-phosphate decarboxylase